MLARRGNVRGALSTAAIAATALALATTALTASTATTPAFATFTAVHTACLHRHWVCVPKFRRLRRDNYLVPGVSVRLYLLLGQMREAARLQPASRRSHRRVAITATTIAIAAAAVTTRRSRHRITATTIIIAAAAITATTRRCHHRVTIVITTSSRSCIVTPSPVNRDDYGHCRRCSE